MNLFTFIHFIMRFSTKSTLKGCWDIIFYISCGKPLGGAAYSALEVISTDFIDIDVFQVYWTTYTKINTDIFKSFTTFIAYTLNTQVRTYVYLLTSACHEFSLQYTNTYILACTYIKYPYMNSPFQGWLSFKKSFRQKKELFQEQAFPINFFGKTTAQKILHMLKF